jgi:hypothetical protein
MRLMVSAVSSALGVYPFDFARTVSPRPRLLVDLSQAIVGSVSEGTQQAIRAFFAGLDEEAHDLAERLAHGDDESVWAWFERRYPKATKRAAKDRHWRDFVRAIREFYRDEGALQ